MSRRNAGVWRWPIVVTVLTLTATIVCFLWDRAARAAGSIGLLVISAVCVRVVWTAFGARWLRASRARDR